MEHRARINLDYASGAPLTREARAAMEAALQDGGNPSAVTAEGRRAARRLAGARRQVAGLIGARPGEIVFTSCGTESNALALRGLMAAHRRRGSHLIVSPIEHPSVLLAARRLEREGASVTTLPVDGEGLIEPEALRAALTPETVLVSIMLANGEIGTVQPIRELAALAREAGAVFHTDAVAAAGLWPLNVMELGVDALSLSGSAFGGPPGAAALFCREGLRLLPLLEGGGQEDGARSGGENLPALAGMGAAAEWAARELEPRTRQLGVLRDRLRDALAGIPGVRFHGSRDSRLPHHLHLTVEGVSSETLVLGLDQAGIAAGLGSACNSKAMRPSHVLIAMGLTEAEAAGALVLTLGADTTHADIDEAARRISGAIERLRRVTALTARA
ncbi:MAG TPA: cysteine desulfurase family protein [bacterium]